MKGTIDSEITPSTLQSRKPGVPAASREDSAETLKIFGNIIENRTYQEVMDYDPNKTDAALWMA